MTAGPPAPLKKSRHRLEAQPNPPPEKPQPADPVFPGNHIKLFNKILADTKLKFDRDNKARAAYSLRHFYICMRLMEGVTSINSPRTAAPPSR